MKKCKDCLWFDKCQFVEDDNCEYYEPGTAEEYEDEMVSEYEKGLRERQEAYMELVFEQNS